MTDEIRPPKPERDASPAGAGSIAGAAAEPARPARRRTPARPDPEAARRAFEAGEYPYATLLTERAYARRVRPL